MPHLYLCFSFTPDTILIIHTPSCILSVIALPYSCSLLDPNMSYDGRFDGESSDLTGDSSSRDHDIELQHVVNETPGQALASRPARPRPARNPSQPFRPSHTARTAGSLFSRLTLRSRRSRPPTSAPQKAASHEVQQADSPDDQQTQHSGAVNVLRNFTFRSRNRSGDGRSLHKSIGGLLGHKSQQRQESIPASSMPPQQPAAATAGPPTTQTISRGQTLRRGATSPLAIDPHQGAGLQANRRASEIFAFELTRDALRARQQKATQARRRALRRIFVGWCMGMLMATLLAVPAYFTDRNRTIFSMTFGTWGLLIAGYTTAWPLCRLLVEIAVCVAHWVWEGSVNVSWRTLKMLDDARVSLTYAVWALVLAATFEPVTRLPNLPTRSVTSSPTDLWWVIRLLVVNFLLGLGLVLRRFALTKASLGRRMAGYVTEVQKSILRQDILQWLTAEIPDEILDTPMKFLRSHRLKIRLHDGADKKDKRSALARPSSEYGDIGTSTQYRHERKPTIESNDNVSVALAGLSSTENDGKNEVSDDDVSFGMIGRSTSRASGLGPETDHFSVDTYVSEENGQAQLISNGTGHHRHSRVSMSSAASGHSAMPTITKTTADPHSREVPPHLEVEDSHISNFVGTTPSPHGHARKGSKPVSLAVTTASSLAALRSRTATFDDDGTKWKAVRHHFAELASKTRTAAEDDADIDGAGELAEDSEPDEDGDADDDAETGAKTELGRRRKIRSSGSAAADKTLQATTLRADDEQSAKRLSIPPDSYKRVSKSSDARKRMNRSSVAVDFSQKRDKRRLKHIAALLEDSEETEAQMHGNSPAVDQQEAEEILTLELVQSFEDVRGSQHNVCRGLKALDSITVRIFQGANG